MRFLKMHGAGNDFVVVDNRGKQGALSADTVRAIGDRHRGVGFDQLAEISGTSGNLTLVFWNADGSQAGACGNATRCVANLIMSESIADHLEITTKRGVLFAKRDQDGAVWVNMGHPQLNWDEVPLSKDMDTLHLPIDGDPAACGMGNPHCVFFVPDITEVDVALRGASIEHHPLFPAATNVEFVQVLDRSKLRMRVWERGTGITLACGSGACASAVSAVRRGLAERRVDIDVDGGILGVDWREDGVWLTGPTAIVFEGALSTAFLETIK